MPETAVMILAAGASRRLGRPKQQLIFENQTLLNRIIHTAISLQSGPVLVVHGDDTFLPRDIAIEPVLNRQWQEGMATSIHAGINALEAKYPMLETVIITVCDQPFITIELLREMIALQQQTSLPIIASVYGETIGTPVLFHKSVFKELLTLSGDKGARQLLKKDSDRVGLVNFPLGKIDIDTEEDYEGLIKQ